MGDSYTASGTLGAAIAAAEGWTTDCKQSETSWPSQLLHQLGVWNNGDYVNVSCLGASLVTGPGYTLAHEARAADAAGAFGPRTRLVAIQLGINDTWGATKSTTFESWLWCIPNFFSGCDVAAAAEGRSPDFRGVTGHLYAERIKAVVDYIRQRAPSARVVLVGYPELHTPGQQEWCIDTLGVGRITQRRAGAFTSFMDRLDEAQRGAAEALGIEFFDTRAITRGHGLCSGEPWLNGFLNVRREFFGIPFHPTVHGDAVVATALRGLVSP
jgi:lysophospholipase L1-like esterase